VKDKWVFPFVPWLTVGWQAAVVEYRGPGWPLDIRVLFVAAAFALTVALLAVIQPWREDPS